MKKDYLSPIVDTLILDSDQNICQGSTSEAMTQETLSISGGEWPEL